MQVTGMVQVFSLYELVLTLKKLYERLKTYEYLQNGTDAFGVSSERLAQALTTLYDLPPFFITRIFHTCSHDRAICSSVYVPDHCIDDTLTHGQF